MSLKFLRLFLFLLFPLSLAAQKADRFVQLQQRLDDLSVSVPGLNQTVRLHVSNIPLGDYLGALASANKLSISVDPKLNFPVSDVFNDATASNVLTFLAKKYNLEITITGSIIYITAYIDPTSLLKPPLKEVKVRYSQLENTLSLELDNDSLTAVAKKISSLSGKNVVVPAGMQGKKVSGFINAAPFDAALEKLAFTNEIKMVRTGDNFYLFQPLDANEELYVNGDRNTASRRTVKPSGTTAGAATGVYSRTVAGQKLLSVDAVNSPIIDLVKQASQEMNKNYSIYSDLKGTITLHATDIAYDNFLSLVFKGTDFTYHSENGIYLMGDSKLEGLRTSKTIQLQNRSIDTVVAMIPADWKKGMEIKEFREQNALLLTGSSARISEVENFVHQLDVLVPMVLIEVTLIDVNKNRTVATGLSAGVADSVKTGGTLLSGMDFTFSANSVNNLIDKIGSLTSVNLGHVVPSFYVNLKALESKNDVDVRSVPKLTALNGHSATMSIGNSVFYKNTTQNVIPVAATSQTLLANTYVESDANMVIAIKPLVAGDDQVTLSIKVDISDFTSIPTDGSPPPKSTSKFESSIRVNNEDMIVLGGIERTEKDDSYSGIPLLSRIPVLKWIFSSKNKSSKRVVTLVFIKPTIMR